MSNETGLALDDRNEQIKATVQLYKAMIVNGKKLSDDEARALAVFSNQTGLDVFSQECYYLPGTGPIPGIQGFRRKAREAAERQAKFANYRMVGKGYQIKFVSGSDVKLEADYDPARGDIAYEAVLVSDMDRAAWIDRLMPIIRQMQESFSMDYPEAHNQAVLLVGPCPETRYVGVVFAGEKFTYDNTKPEKMDRHERAKKRAEKGALKKHFELNMPMMDDPETATLSISEPEPVRERLNMSTNQALSELGFDTPKSKEEEPEQPHVIDEETGEISEGEFTSLVTEAENLGGKVVEQSEENHAAELSLSELAARINELNKQLKADPKNERLLSERDNAKLALEEKRKK
jgi:hypothetical protein